MAAAIPVVSSIAGPLLGTIFGAKGASGKQGTQTQDTVRELLQSMMSSTSQSGSTTPIENPTDQLFRQGLQGLFGNELAKLQRPIYGAREKAQGIQDIQDTIKGSLKTALQGLAGAGALDSGRATQAALTSGLGEASSITNFLNQIPLQNEQARRTGVGGLLENMRSLAQIAPVGQRSTATGTSTQTGKTNETGKTTGTLQGPSFGTGLMQGLGYGFGSGAFDPLLSLIGNFFKPTNSINKSLSPYGDEG